MGIVTILPETTKNPITLMGARAGCCWNANVSDDEKYGRFIYKEQIEKPLPNHEENTCLRNVWLAHDAFELYESGGKQRFLELGVIPIKIIE